MLVFELLEVKAKIEGVIRSCYGNVLCHKK